MSGEQLRPYFGSISQFFRISLANLLQIVLMAALLLNWYGNRESNSGAQTVIMQQHGDRITKLEEAGKQTAVALNDLQRKMDVLVAIAEEARKSRK